MSRTGWTKNGIYKGKTLVQWGGGVAPELWTLCYRSCMAIFGIFFDNNVCNRKRSTYLKRFFKTLSKSRIIKLLVKLRSNNGGGAFTCKPLKKRFIEIVVWVFDLKTAGPIVLSILARFSLHWFYCIFIQGVRNQSARIWVLSVLTIPCQIPQTETRLDALLHVDTSSRSNR